ncbi:MAG: sulfatase-like hydrolase/transferase [Chlorobi bacterium]|nr:sulfatase-like hydrolase/transferase [Chlorobiota bacterium]
MKKTILFYLKYPAFWIGYFLLLKVIFLLFNVKLTLSLPWKEIPLIFYHGFSMDLSAAFYALIFPTLMIILSPVISWKILRPVIDVYTVVFLSVISLLFVADLELYHYWNFRLDKTPLKYLDSPRVMLASVHAWVIVRQLLIAAGLFLLSGFVYLKIITTVLPGKGRSNWKVVPVFVFLLAFSLIPIRGGLGVAPMNSGFVWFSSHPFANHAALNMPFHLAESLVNNQPEKNPFVRFPETEAKAYYKDLFPDGQSGTVHVWQSSRPNIIVIVLESFTAKVIEPLGGLEGVTPNMTRFARQGILFSHFFASGDRTDKALPAILSAFPAMPDQSVTKISGKAEHLPSLPARLQTEGYHTAFYYGGTIDFAGLRSYLVSMKFDRIMDIEDFPKSDRTSKWGVHDGITFDSLFNDIDRTPAPFFKVMLTLSSHEPYDVPMQPVFPGKDEETLFLNSLYYTDSILGRFVDRAMAQPWWDSTLVILVADHGVRLPGNTPNEAIEKFKIPMIWLGGVLSVKDTIITKTASQTDIFPTLAGQMSVHWPDCPFGKNIFSYNSHSFAWFAFNNGFGFVTDTAAFVMDNVSGKILHTQGNITDDLLNRGEALRQLTYDYFLGL